jgi:hypothetical protein
MTKNSASVRLYLYLGPYSSNLKPLPPPTFYRSALTPTFLPKVVLVPSGLLKVLSRMSSEHGNLWDAPGLTLFYMAAKITATNCFVRYFVMDNATTFLRRLRLRRYWFLFKHHRQKRAQISSAQFLRPFD